MRAGFEQGVRRWWLVCGLITILMGLLAGSVWLKQWLQLDTLHITEHIPTVRTPVTGNRWYWNYSQWQQNEVPQP